MNAPPKVPNSKVLIYQSLLFFLEQTFVLQSVGNARGKMSKTNKSELCGHLLCVCKDVLHFQILKIKPQASFDLSNLEIKKLTPILLYQFQLYTKKVPSSASSALDAIFRYMSFYSDFILLFNGVLNRLVPCLKCMELAC